MEERRRLRFLVSALLLLVFGACGAAIYFWRQNVELRSRQEPASVRVERVSEGRPLPEFTARDTEGREVRVAARGEGNLLLFIFSPACERCEACLPAWIKVNNKLAELQSRVPVIALSTGDSYTTVEHARRTKTPFVVVPFPSLDLQKQYGVTEVPLTIVVDAKGIAQAVWDKPLDEGEIADVVEAACPDCIKRAVNSPH